MHSELEAARAQFSHDELQELEARRIDTLYRKQPDALSLAIGWMVWIAQFDADRKLPSTDVSVRTEHDLAGALFTRDSAEDAIGTIPDRLGARIVPFLEVGDNGLVSFTKEDPDAIMTKIAGIDPLGQAWWWFRRPVDGPLVDFLRFWDAPR